MANSFHFCPADWEISSCISFITKKLARLSLIDWKQSNQLTTSFIEVGHISEHLVSWTLWQGRGNRHNAFLSADEFNQEMSLTCLEEGHMLEHRRLWDIHPPTIPVRRSVPSKKPNSSAMTPGQRKWYPGGSSSEISRGEGALPTRTQPCKHFGEKPGLAKITVFVNALLKDYLWKSPSQVVNLCRCETLGQHDLCILIEMLPHRCIPIQACPLVGTLFELNSNYLYKLKLR